MANKAALESHESPTQARRRALMRRAGRLVTDNLGLKLTAIALSVMLFSLVHSDVDAQRSMYVDVVTLPPPPGSDKMLVSELPTQVKVTLRGSSSKLSGLSRDQLPPVQLDLRSASSGNYYIDPRKIDLGSNVQVVEISPAMIPLTWATAAEKRVSVQVELQGELDKRRTLAEEARAEPASVTVRGPEPRIQSMHTVSTEPVSLDGLAVGTHRRRVALMPLPDHVSYVEDATVEVSLAVVPVVDERTFKGLKVAAIGDQHVELRPAHVAVTLRGPHDLLEELDAEVIVPYVELEAPGTGPSRPLDIKLRGLPQGVEVVRVLPPSALVWLKGK